jgi:ureidoacrylate peracid hydrolase
MSEAADREPSMHKVTLPEELRVALRQRRGRDDVFPSWTPARTALLVVDMQNHFVAPGALAEVPLARGIVPNINRLAEALRRARGLVVWIRSTFAPDGAQAWPMFFDNFVTSAEARAALRLALSPGQWGHEFWPALDIRDGDLIVSKTRFSAFIQGASDLEPLLRQRGIDTVLVAGTLTNVCCESTARDAMMRDFRAIMIEDANAARSDADHLAGLSTVVQVFGDVVTTETALARLTVPAALSA